MCLSATSRNIIRTRRLALRQSGFASGLYRKDSRFRRPAVL